MPIRTMKIQNTETPNAGEGAEPKELSFTAGGNAKRYNHFGRQCGGFSQN